MPEQKSAWRRFMVVVGDARNIGWLVPALSAGGSFVVTALVGASLFLSTMPSGWRTLLIAGIALFIFAALLVPSALLARKLAAWIGEAPTGAAVPGDRQKVRYGEELPTFPALSGTALHDVLRTAHEFRQGFRGLVSATDDAWAQLRNMIQRHVGQPSSDVLFRQLLWRAERIEAAERRHFNHIATDFERIVERHEEDPRPYLIGAYTRYRKWREEIRALTKASGNVMAMYDCIKWRAAEQRLAAEFMEKLATTELRPVQNLFIEYNNRNGHLNDLCQDD